jgi:hypothetical protein
MKLEAHTMIFMEKYNPLSKCKYPTSLLSVRWYVLCINPFMLYVLCINPFMLYVLCINPFMLYVLD